MNDNERVNRTISFTNPKTQTDPIEQIDNLDKADAEGPGLPSALVSAAVSINQEVKSVGETEYLVTWQDEESDPGNPKNWALGRKARALVGMSMFVFISVFSVSLIAPALPAIASELHIEQPAVQEMTLSIFLLGFAFGPLVASPLSEVYGRVRVIRSWNLLYTIFSAVCGASQSKEALIVLRFISGVFASATLGIGGGTISDLYRSKDRGQGVAIYSWCSVAGPLLGVILGGFITKYTTWRWAFFATSILSACIQLIGLYMLEETYPPLLLRRRKQTIINQTGDIAYYTNYDHLDHVTVQVLSQNLVRPFKLLATQPIIQFMALYNGCGLATVIYSMTIDRIYGALSTKNGGKGKPEFRIPVMVPGTFLLGIGLIWYGWSAEADLHWIMPNIGCGLFVAGATVCTSSVNAYIVDTYGQHSASAIASISILRCLAGFTFPMFAPYMYDRLGYGWAATVLGLIALGIGSSVLWLLWNYGLYLRQRSPYIAEKVSEARHAA